MADIRDLSKTQEENIIGALLKNPEKITMVREILSVEDFANIALGWAYGAMLSLHDRGLGVDSVTLGDELERHGKAQDFVIGDRVGRIALAELRANFKGDLPEAYATKILGYAAKRRMLEEFATGTGWAFNGREPNEIRDDMIRRLTNIKVPNAKANQHTQTFKEALSKNYDEVNNGNVSFVPSGFTDIDRALDGGMYAPDFMIVAGRPGSGKTALMLSIAMNAAKKGKRVVMFSLEMSNSQIVMRAASMETGIPFGDMRSRKMNEEQKQKYNQFIEDFENLPIHLNDLSSISVNVMRQTLREIIAIHGQVDLVIVDYLQLQGVDGKFGNRQEEVSSISRGLKSMCKEFDMPVLAGAQLSREVEKRAEKRPVLSDLRESGSMEQDSDIVSFLYVADEYKNTGSTDFIIAKHRNGPVGTFPLFFNKKRTKFENGARYE